VSRRSAGSFISPNFSPFAPFSLRPLTLSLSSGAAGSAAHRPAACATRGEGTHSRKVKVNEDPCE